MFGRMIEDYERALKLINDKINRLEEDRSLREGEKRTLKEKYMEMIEDLTISLNKMKNWGHEKILIKPRDFF